MKRITANVPVRYVLLQLPGLVLVVIALRALGYFIDIPCWAAVLVVVLWIGKEAVLFPLLRRSYEKGSSPMIGKTGHARAPLDPEGYIMLDGQLWKARAEGGSVEKGERVIVTGLEGLLLFVKKTDG